MHLVHVEVEKSLRNVVVEIYIINIYEILLNLVK